MPKRPDQPLQLVDPDAQAPATRTLALPDGLGAVIQQGNHVTVQAPEEVNPLRPIGGSSSIHFNATLLSDTLAAMPPDRAGGPDLAERMAAAIAALAAFKPTDEIEGMIAGQAVAMHHMALECFRRGMLTGQDPEAASKLRRDGANMARGMTDMLDALDRRRGKGTQLVRVERVTVHEGGQAIVGNVQAAGSKPGGGSA